MKSFFHKIGNDTACRTFMHTFTVQISMTVCLLGNNFVKRIIAIKCDVIKTNKQITKMSWKTPALVHSYWTYNPYINTILHISQNVFSIHQRTPYALIRFHSKIRGYKSMMRILNVSQTSFLSVRFGSQHRISNLILNLSLLKKKKKKMFYRLGYVCTDIGQHATNIHDFIRGVKGILNMAKAMIKLRMIGILGWRPSHNHSAV